MKVLYGAEWCVGCQTLKRQLTANNISFEYRDADEVKNMRALAEIGVRSLPFATVNGRHHFSPELADFMGGLE